MGPRSRAISFGRSGRRRSRAGCSPTMTTAGRSGAGRHQLRLVALAFGGDYGAVGRQVRLGSSPRNRHRSRTAGVRFPAGSGGLGRQVHVGWPTVEQSATLQVFRAVARLKHGVGAAGEGAAGRDRAVVRDARGGVGKLAAGDADADARRDVRGGPSGGVDSARRGVPGAVYRLRERGESAAESRRGATARTGGAGGAGRRTRQARGTADRGGRHVRGGAGALGVALAWAGSRR